MKSLLVKIFLFHTVSKACTEFRLTAKDSSVVLGRSMEFGVDAESDLHYEPKGYVHTAMYPEKCRKGIEENGPMEALTWENRNAVVWIDANKMPFVVIDGQNTAGLSFGSLYFDGYGKYQDIPLKDCGNTVSQLQFGLFILGNFETVEEVREAINNDTFPLVWEQAVDFGEAKSVVFALHYSITDKTGDSLIIEYSDKGRTLFENPVGIITNSPPYDFHMTNLRNYVHVSNFAHETLVLGETGFNPTGQGSGLLGIPGDYTPPSRLIRAALISSFSDTPETSEAAVNLAAHILNTVDIPHGLLRVKLSDDADYTQWVLMKDLSTNTLYYRVYNDLTIRSIPLDNLGTRKLKMKVGRTLGGFVDTSDEFKPVDGCETADECTL